MIDFLVFMAVLLGTYVCSCGFVVAMVRVFFQLKTKEEREKVSALGGVNAQRHAPKFRRVPQAVASESGQLA